MGVEGTVRRLVWGQEWREPAGWWGVRLGKELGQVTHRLGVNHSEDSGLIKGRWKATVGGRQFSRALQFHGGCPDKQPLWGRVDRKQVGGAVEQPSMVLPENRQREW